MFGIDGRTKLLTRFLGSCCIALAMLSSLVPSEQPVESTSGLGASTKVLPGVEVSDTAIQQIAYRLTQANLNHKSLAALISQQSGTGPQLTRFGASAKQRGVPKLCSLLILGTSLRL